MTVSATLRLFGGFSLRGVSGEPISLSLRKGEALVAYLAAAKTRRCTRDQLATLLWGDSSQSSALQSLRQARLSLLRDLSTQNLPILTFDRREIHLEHTALDVDVVEFAQLVETGDMESLARAAAIYRGDFLAGFEVGSEAFDDWLQPTRAWYREQVETALSRLIDLQEKAGAAEAAIHTAKCLLAINPLREDIHRWLMRAFIKKGQRSSALATYEACRAILHQDIDVDPEEETTALYDAILSQRPPPRLREGADRPAVAGAPPITAVPTPEPGTDRAFAALARLDSTAAQVIQVAAVADGRCAAALVAYVTEIPSARIEAVMKDLCVVGLLRQGENGAPGTVLEMIRSHVVEQLLPSHRKHLHYAVALALEEEARGDLSDACHDIARHFRAAGNPARAAPQALKSGQIEVDRENFDLAQAQFSAALADLGQTPMGAERSHLEAEAHVLLADLAELRGDLNRADDLLSEAMPAVKQHADPRLLTAALLAKSRLHQRRGRTDRAYGCIKQAAQHSKNGTIDGCWLLTERFAYLTSLVTDGALSPVQALSIAQQRIHAAGRRSSAVDVAALQALFDASQGKFAAAYPGAAQAMRLSGELADTTSHIVSLQALGIIQTWNGEAEAALDHLDRAFALAVERGDLPRQYTSRGYRGFALLNAGRWTEAVAELGEALAMSEKLDLRFMQAMFMAWLAEALIGFGDADRALTVARTAARLATEWNQPWPRSVAFRALAQAVGATSAGERKLAGRLIRTALETQTSLGLPFETARSLGTQALIGDTLH
jgi:DNA-binding SARP family transcriptional activator